MSHASMPFRSPAAAAAMAIGGSADELIYGGDVGSWEAGAVFEEGGVGRVRRFDAGEERDDLPSGMAGMNDVVANYYGASYVLLDYHRSDVAFLARFAHRVEFATFHMCAAFELANVRDFDPRAERSSQSGRRRVSWFASLAETTLHRFKTLRRALQHDWTPPAEVEPLTRAAFQSLCYLAPESAHGLRLLFNRQRSTAIERLVESLDLHAKRLEHAVAVASAAEAALVDRTAQEDATRLASTQAGVLERAGEPLGLTAAAQRLGTTRQNLHKRIQSGSALGVMRGRELVVPSVQFVETDTGTKIVDGLKEVLKLFGDAQAGGWSALQFLVEHDAMVGGIPVEALNEGRKDEVMASARAYLGEDES